MRSYQWWKKQKKRVQKKYTLWLGRYMSPKENRELFNCWTGRKRWRIERQDREIEE